MRATPAPEQVTAALEPLRAELLRAAQADAAALLDRAERQAAAVTEAARAEAETILAEARSQGEADGAKAAAAALARARRTARSRELAVRREAYEELRRRATEAVLVLRHSPDYPAALDRLGRRARQLLGPGADITEDPGGGVLARAPGRRADLTLDASATRALDGLGAEAETLWTP